MYVKKCDWSLSTVNRSKNSATEESSKYVVRRNGMLSHETWFSFMLQR